MSESESHNTEYSSSWESVPDFQALETLDQLMEALNDGAILQELRKSEKKEFDSLSFPQQHLEGLNNQHIGELGVLFRESKARACVRFRSAHYSLNYHCEAPWPNRLETIQSWVQTEHLPLLWLLAGIYVDESETKREELAGVNPPEVARKWLEKVERRIKKVVEAIEEGDGAATLQINGFLMETGIADAADKCLKIIEAQHNKPQENPRQFRTTLYPHMPTRVMDLSLVEQRALWGLSILMRKKEPSRRGAARNLVHLFTLLGKPLSYGHQSGSQGSKTESLRKLIEMWDSDTQLSCTGWNMPTPE